MDLCVGFGLCFVVVLFLRLLSVFDYFFFCFFWDAEHRKLCRILLLASAITIASLMSPSFATMNCWRVPPTTIVVLSLLQHHWVEWFLSVPHTYIGVCVYVFVYIYIYMCVCCVLCACFTNISWVEKWF